MSAKPDGGPAFPVSASRPADRLPGMTLRQRYAGKALQGFLSSALVLSVEDLTRDSFVIADAMIAHEKGEK